MVLLSADLAAMWDSVAHNAGFVVVRPTRHSLAVYERVKRITGFSRKTDDQTALNTAIQAVNRAHKRHGFSAVMLDRKKYARKITSFLSCSASVQRHSRGLKSTKLHFFDRHCKFATKF